MNKLVVEIVKPILEANTKIKKVVGIYGGRFQPFGPHHLKTYKWLAKQVDDAYITTSNIKKPPRHPMNFKEKVRHMTKMGIPSSKIVEEKTPYVAKNVLKKFNNETTAVVYIFGKKDAGRLQGGTKKSGGKTYYQDFKRNKKNLEGYETHGYILTAPHVSISVGGKEVSGTSMRELLGSSKLDDSDRAKLFKKMFGYYDKGLFSMLVNKFKKLFEASVTGTATTFIPPSIVSKQATFGNTTQKAISHKSSDAFISTQNQVTGSLDSKRKDEQDINIVPYSKSNKKKKDPKLFDKKEKDLLQGWLEEGGIIKLKKLLTKHVPQNIISNNTKLIAWIQKNPGLVNQILRLAMEGKEVNEAFTIPIEIGDTVLMGKFKNKKVVVKSIDINEKGDVVINGKSASKFRLTKKPNIFDEEIIKEFLTKIDMKKIIDEASTATGNGINAVDSGPSFAYGNFRTYKGRNEKEANQLGWSVLNYLLWPDTKDWKDYPTYPDGPVTAVSYGPAGDGTGKSPNNQVDLVGSNMWNAYKSHINKVATAVGYELADFLYGVNPGILGSTGKFEKGSLTQGNKDREEIQQESVFSKDWWKGLLQEGGAYGHMAHPFDDKDLTFGDLKKIIELGLGGQLNREDNVTEKLDGQNIMISWKDGKLIAARNKGHIKNGGKTALSTSGIASKFEGRGEIRNAFVYAMKDLEKSIKGLSQKQKDKIFNNGYNFMNMEVMWPASANVIDYDIATLVFHGALKYDDKGNVIGEVPGSGRILAGMIKQINQHIQKKYKIGKPVFLTVPKHQDFGKMKGKFLGRLNKLQSEFGLKESDTLGLYHQKWWEQFILKQLKKVSPKVLKGLVKRWAFFDKSYKIPTIKQDLKDEPIFLEWVLKFDKKDHSAQVKKNMKPFEELFFEVGAEILKNVQGFIAANPKKAVQGIVKRLDNSIKNVQKGGDLKKLNTLKLQLDKLNSIGGTTAIVPSEGLVFKYKGKTYKFTGAFAPVNQITGLVSF